MTQEQFKERYNEKVRTKTITAREPLSYEEFLLKKGVNVCYKTLLLNEKQNTIFFFINGFDIYELPNTEENYYNCLDKLYELWRDEK